MFAKRVFKYLVIITVACKTSGKDTGSKNDNETYKKPVVVKIVKPESISQEINLAASVKGYPDVYVFPDMPGKILKINVSDGQFVSKGQILALIDRSAPGFDVEPLTVISPISGYVQVLVKDIGYPVSPSTPIFRIVGKEKLYVELNIPEVFAHKIKKGTKVEIDGSTGKVINVSPALDMRTRTLPVEAVISGNFIPGQSVVAKVEIERADSTIVLPSSAFVGESEDYVFIIRSLTAKKVKVETGIKTSKGYEVKKGLKFGDTVVVFGANTLKDGDSVNILEVIR